MCAFLVECGQRIAQQVKCRTAVVSAEQIRIARFAAIRQAAKARGTPMAAVADKENLFIVAEEAVIGGIFDGTVAEGRIIGIGRFAVGDLFLTGAEHDAVFRLEAGHDLQTMVQDADRVLFNRLDAGARKCIVEFGKEQSAPRIDNQMRFISRKACQYCICKSPLRML